VLALAALGTSGCATATNLERGHPKPFGGSLMGCGTFLVPDPNQHNLGTGFAVLMFWPVWLADKPLSLVGDLVTLPYVLYERSEYRHPTVESALYRLQSVARPAAPDLVGLRVDEARELARACGYQFIQDDDGDGYPRGARGQGRRIIARVRGGVVVSARAHGGPPVPTGQ
jgi:uncharacterized protein YceK